MIGVAPRELQSSQARVAILVLLNQVIRRIVLQVVRRFWAVAQTVLLDRWEKPTTPNDWSFALGFEVLAGYEAGAVVVCLEDEQIRGALHSP